MASNKLPPVPHLIQVLGPDGRPSRPWADWFQQLFQRVGGSAGTDAVSVANDLAAHIAETTDAHDASAISSIASGNLASDNVQDALNELQGDSDSIDARMDAAESAITNGIITGEVRMWAGTGDPTGWLLCDGRSLARSGTYAALFAAIGTAFGTADGSHFNIPDLRGRFVRGQDDMGTAAGAASRDTFTRSAMATGGATSGLGSVQADAFQGHWRGLYYGPGGFYPVAANDAQTSGNSFSFFDTGGTSDPSTGNFYAREAFTDGTNGTPRESAETRPVNAALNYIIKI
ncbi:MAG TPA: tail fiber protein [Bdellovibrionota bacterium]|jgi:hypothetical protein|nr:tail fiber protein [Bdellovibrionota bacterium]